MEKHSFSDTPHIDARQRLHTAAAVQTSRTPIQGFSIVCLNFTSPERIMQAPIFPCSFYLSQLHPIQIYELSEILINIPPYKMMLMAQTRTLSDGGCVSERRISRSKMKGEREEKPVSAFLPSGKSIMAGPLQGVLERPCRFHYLFSPIRHYFPDWRAVNWSAAGAAHGNCTPPRIAPSCNDVLKVSLCRSTIVRKHGIPFGMSCSFFSNVMYHCTNNISQ